MGNTLLFLFCLYCCHYLSGQEHEVDPGFGQLCVQCEVRLVIDALISLTSTLETQAKKPLMTTICQT